MFGAISGQISNAVRGIKDRTGKWSTRKMVLFCLVTCGAFWALLIFIVLKLF